MLMQRIYTSQLEKYVGKEVLISGWCHDVRLLGGINFILLRDKEGIAQVKVEKKSSPREILDLVEKIHQEDVLVIKGKVVRSKVAKAAVEVVPSKIEVVSKAEVPLPLDPRNVTPANLDTRLEWKFIDLRKPESILIYKIGTAIEMAMRKFWIKNGFIEIHSPKLMGSPSETGAELFSVPYFGRTAYLAQSPQFYKQMAMAAGFEKVFEIGQVFRANPSETTRHDTEFTSIDMEMSWIDSHEDVMKFEERWLSYVLKSIKKNFGSEIKENFGVEVIVPKIPFPRVTMQEAHEITGCKPVETRNFSDLDSEGEKMLCKYVLENKKHEFVFIKDFPWRVRPFYHMKLEDDPTKTKSFDLLWKGLEITTGAQREHRYNVLVEQAKEKGIKLDNIKFYLDFFKYGCPPHGGFGFGQTRFLMQLLGFKNVREVTFAPRDMKRLFP